MQHLELHFNIDLRVKCFKCTVTTVAQKPLLLTRDNKPLESAKK